jgi:hypothetical protein
MKKNISTCCQNSEMRFAEIFISCNNGIEKQASIHVFDYLNFIHVPASKKNAVFSFEWNYEMEEDVNIVSDLVNTIVFNLHDVFWVRILNDGILSWKLMRNVDPKKYSFS